MSSTSSLNSPNVVSPGRRRATSLAANDKTVITTDMVRPDWAKKLADAKAHALRRAAAATALHNAAYMMGSIQQQESRFGLGRRRRMFGSDSAGSSGQGTPRREGEASSGRGPEGSNDLFPGRISSRRGNRIDDLEELMMMEAIRLSLAAEEERKRKEEKEVAKEAKKEGKKKAKENKKVAKAQRNIGSGFHPVEIDGVDDADAGTSAAAGKGKAVDRSPGSVGFNPMTEPTSTINASTAKDDPQKHLEDSRAQIQRETLEPPNLSPFDPFGEQPSYRSALRNLSNASSSASSFAESYQNSLHQDSQNNLAPSSAYGPSPNASGVSLSQGETPPQGTPEAEPMFNFQSLAEAINPEEGKDENATQHIENIEERKPDLTNTAPATSDMATSSTQANTDPSEPLGESVMTLKPSPPAPVLTVTNEDDDEITPAPRVEVVPDDHSFDQKQYGDVSMVDTLSHHQATQ